MEFPLSIVKEFARERGYEVLRSPSNVKKTFDWVMSTEAGARCLGGHAAIVAPAAIEKRDGLAITIVNEDFAKVGRNSIVLDCKGASPAEIADELQVYLMRIYRWVEDMHHALEQHCDCAELLALSEPVLKNFVSVSDSAFYHIAHTAGIEPIEDASRYLIEHGRYGPETIEAVGRSGLSELWKTPRPFLKYDSNAINPRPSIDHVYHLNSQYAAHLVMICKEPITEGQEFLFSLLIGPVRTALDYLWRNDNPLKKRYTTFLLDIMHGGGGSKDAARNQAKALGIPLTGVFKVCLALEPWRGSSESYFVERVLTLLPGCWAIADKDGLAILLHGEGTRRSGVLAALEAKAFDLAVDIETQVGVSRKFFDLFGAAAALEEARIALKYGKAHFGEFLESGGNSNDCYTASVYRFKRYFPFYVGDMRAYKADFLRKHNLVDEVIGAIERDDREYGTSDALILKAYLRHSCKVKAAAEALGMHRNSIAYRIKHIERTYDLDLSDPDDVAFLAALYLLPR